MSAFCPDGCPGPIDACVVGHPCALHPAEPDAGEVEAREWLMQVVGEALMLEPAPDADTVTDAILASDWLADYVRRATR